jgi:inhibitor of KinA sporulation pathway (predicted exonuclease)
MYYITLDLEWNQAYAQKALAVQRRLACRLRGEVIQIGAVKMDSKMNICGSYQVIVKPQHFKKLHRHVSELTGITQEQMDVGMPLPEAAESFKKWCGKDFCFLTWGPDDIPMLKENFHIHDIPSDWLDRVYDLQVIFNRQTEDTTKQRSLEYAMEHFGLEQHLPAHDALNDAYFTALVARELDVPEGVRTYSSVRGEFLLDTVIGDADAGDDGYVTISEMLDDPIVKNPVCPICKKEMCLMCSMTSIDINGKVVNLCEECWATDAEKMIEDIEYINIYEPAVDIKAEDEKECKTKLTKTKRCKKQKTL